MEEGLKFKVIYSARASKQLAEIPARDYFGIISQIDALRTNPLPRGIKKMKGYKDYYRLRKGDYRIVYKVEFKIVTITIIQLGHRKDIYDNLS